MSPSLEPRILPAVVVATASVEDAAKADEPNRSAQKNVANARENGR
jgi:hypothetical protein